ncbi:MAG: hypothetical protein ACLPOO_18920 [Terriglobales bacterium]|jgi:hypothetical protein
MTLLILLVLAGIPLLGVVWIAVYGSLTTVDGLFMSLILLAMSGILGATALFELRRPKSASGASFAGRAVPGGLVQSGRVQDVVFYEAHVGVPNKSIVTLSNDGKSSQTLVVEGDARNALPVGQKVQITLRKQHGQNVLADVVYS